MIKQDRLFYCEIDLDINSEFLRFFPVRDEKLKYNKYPFGIHRIKTSEEGIKFIIKYGGWENIQKIHTVLVGEENKEILPFKDYVELFYRLRKEDEGNNTIFKLLLNSLYGKFGQKEKRDVKYINSTKKEKPKNIVNFGNIFVSTFEEGTEFYNLGTLRLDIAGKITELARLKMGDYINQIRKSYGLQSVIYTDTDSIITYANLEKDENLKHLIDDNKLGLLSNEIGYKDSFICLGQKMYHFYRSGKKATKGVKNMNLEDFRGVIRGSKKFENKRFSKMNALVNRGFHGIQTVPYELRNIKERLD